LNRKYVILATVLLIVLISLSLFLAVNVLKKQTATSPFYVGVEFAYGSQFSQLKALVDKVENYSNLIVIGSIDLTFNRTALDESCDYIFNSGLNFIVLFTSYTMYNASNGWGSYTIFDWIVAARQKYGDQFLGIYRFDEPGGNQLDKTQFMLINNTSTFSYPDNPTGYAEVSEGYVGYLTAMLDNYFIRTNYTTKIFTADYGLYWFDYNGSYNAVFGEFLVNQSSISKQLTIALDRGAAESFNRNWGIILTYSSLEPPYLENGTAMLQDMLTSYHAGATYIVVFDYPTYPATNPYGILSQDQFSAMENFWNQIHSNPSSFDSSKARVAYVVPENYGFGFRNPDDTIWGLFPADGVSSKIWNDTEFLLGKYGTNLNIIYDEPGVIDPTLKDYEKVFYWNQTIT